MKNSLMDLNNILFEQLERLNDDEIMKGEQAELEKARAKSINDISKQIISGAKLQLDAMKFREEYNVKNIETPDVLVNKKQKLLEERK